jgi:hypothetical protein
MALRGTLTHWKTRKLAKSLGIDLSHALGLLEALWHTTAEDAPGGDIGRLSNDAIAMEMWTDIEPDRLIQALIDSGHLDKHKNPEYRLVIHDWDRHVDYNIRRKLARWGKNIHTAKGDIPPFAPSPVADASSPVTDASSGSFASYTLSDASSPVTDASSPVTDASSPVADASSTVIGGIPEPVPGPVPVQKQKQRPIPTLPPAPRSQGTKNAPAGSTPELSAAEISKPDSPAIMAPDVAERKSVSKAKPSKRTSGAPLEGGEDEEGQPSRQISVAPAKNRGAAAKILVVRPSKTRISRKEAKEEIFRFWKLGGPKGFDCPWAPAENRALDSFLKQNSGVDFPHFKELLINRSQSEKVNLAAPPHKWLRDLIKYADGPLDAFGKAMKPRREL